MKKYFKRYLALVLTFALVLAVPFAFTTQKADAAAKKSKKATVLLETKTVHTYKNAKGKTVKETTKYTYNKRGFVTKAKTSGKDGGRAVYKYTKKGYLKSVKFYNKKGKLVYKVTAKMNKNGMPYEAKAYYKDGKKFVLDSTTTIIYSGKTPVKSTVKYVDGETETEDFAYYDDFGESKEWYTEGFAENIKKDKKGRVISEEDSEEGWVLTYKYNKAGWRTKVTKTLTKDFDGNPTNEKYVTTFKTFKMTKANAHKAQLNNVYMLWW